jgi:hypothetical protein
MMCKTEETRTGAAEQSGNGSPEQCHLHHPEHNADDPGNDKQ